MKKTIIAFSFIAGLSFGVFAADEYYKNMPTYADGHHTPRMVQIFERAV